MMLSDAYAFHDDDDVMMCDVRCHLMFIRFRQDDVMMCVLYSFVMMMSWKMGRHADPLKKRALFLCWRSDCAHNWKLCYLKRLLPMNGNNDKDDNNDDHHHPHDYHHDHDRHRHHEKHKHLTTS